MKAYYNEYDKRAAAWLRQLIKEGLIADGDVDERSINDVTPNDLRGYGQCHFFAGIGGWSLALRMAGVPDDRSIWTGSCPCQPFSAAGKGEGTNDPRHLWPAFRWLIAQRNPSVVFGEQVASKAGRGWLAGIRFDLEGMGYGVGAADLCAAGVNAPHLRQRLWWVAHSESPKRERGEASRGRGVRLTGSGDITGRLANPEGERIDGECISGKEQGEDAEQERAEPVGSNKTRRLANTDGRNASSEREQRSGEQRLQSEGAEGSGLANTNGFHDDRTGHGSSDDRGKRKEAGALRGQPHHWNGPTTLWPCKDGVLRRISSQPSIFPLAARLPHRVGLLRGAGNAIVPELAAEFVIASLN